MDSSCSQQGPVADSHVSQVNIEYQIALKNKQSFERDLLYV